MGPEHSCIKGYDQHGVSPATPELPYVLSRMNENAPQHTGAVFYCTITVHFTNRC